MKKKNLAKMITLTLAVTFFAGTVPALMPSAMAAPVVDSGNTVEISTDKVSGYTYGGHAEDWSSDDATANENMLTVNAEGKNVSFFYGGYARVPYSGQAVANGNTLIINNGNFISQLRGGYAVANDYECGTDSIAAANNNTVYINGGVSVSQIDGGYAKAYVGGSATANDNIVNITGGDKISQVRGGQVTVEGVGTATANNNIINISGGKIEGNIYGGNATIDSGRTVSVNNNTIKIFGVANVSDAILVGGLAVVGGIWDYAIGIGNKLIVDGWSGDVYGLRGFQNYEFSGITQEFVNAEQAILSINDHAVNGIKSSIGEIDNNTTWQVGFDSETNVKIDDTVTLIDYSKAGMQDVVMSNEVDAAAPTGIESNKEVAVTAAVGIASDVVGKVSNNAADKKIVFTATEEQIASSQLVAVGEGSIAEALLIDQSADLIANSIAHLNESGKYGVETFAIMEAYDNEYDTAGDLNVNGWNLVAGVGKNTQTKAGDFAWGVFYERGDGDYSFTNERTGNVWYGNADMEYEGAGIAARLLKDSGFYTEASIRMGNTESKVQNGLMTAGGDLVGYDTDRDYYSYHIGVGKKTDLGNGKAVDLYVKYLHTTLDDETLTFDKDKIELDKIYSDRLKLGVRCSKQAKKNLSVYYGAAYEYEFSGESEGTANGKALRTASLQGSTVVGELGINIGDTKWTFDAGLRAYTGERDGVGGSVTAVYHF